MSLKDHLVYNVFIVVVQTSVKQTTLHQLGLRSYSVSLKTTSIDDIYQKDY